MAVVQLAVMGRCAAAVAAARSFTIAGVTNRGAVPREGHEKLMQRVHFMPAGFSAACMLACTCYFTCGLNFWSPQLTRACRRGFANAWHTAATRC